MSIKSKSLIDIDSLPAYTLTPTVEGGAIRKYTVEASNLTVLDLHNEVTIKHGDKDIFCGFVTESMPERLEVTAYFGLGNRSAFASLTDPTDIQIETDGFDWLAYAQETEQKFIDRFAHLDESERPDKAVEIERARRIKTQRKKYTQAMEVLETEMRQFVLANPHQKYDEEFLRYLFPPANEKILDNFGISSDDVRAKIEELGDA